eukprot:s5249_g2.t1
MERQPLPVARVVLGEICLRFVWQVWHLATSAFVLCGRRGTHGTGLALVAALVAAGRGDAAPLLCGRRGAWRNLPSFCVAGVALGDISLRFVWQAWHSRYWAGAGGGLGRRWSPGRRASVVWQAWCLATSAFVLCGVECEVWSVEREVWSVEREVRSVKCGVWSVKCGVSSVEKEV